ncbi:MAG: chromate transporter [Fusobacteriaceae bacterium]
MKFYLEFFMIFFKIGLFTLGGGYAMIPLIKENIVDNKKWMKEMEFIDVLGIAQSCPGALAVNVSVFVGWKLKRFLGILVAVLGAVLPSFIIILIIAIFFKNLENNSLFISIFKGIKPAIVALIIAPAIGMGKTIKLKPLKWIISIIVGVIIAFTKISPIIFIVGSMILGNIFSKNKEKEI